MAEISCVIETLETGGWVQGQYEINGAHCILGAVRECNGMSDRTWDYWRSIANDEIIAIGKVIVDVFPERIADWTKTRLTWPDRDVDFYSTVIADFNDHEDTSFGDVQYVLHKAQELSQASE
jgi:hypothetical protein